MLTNRATTGTMGSAILGATGDGEDWRDLRNHLVDLGFHVDLFDATPSGEMNDPDAMVPTRSDRIELAVLVVAKSEHDADGFSGRRLVHLAGVLQGRPDVRRLVVLREVDVAPFLDGTGVTELAFERGEIESRFDEVDAILRELNAPGVAPTTPWMERFGIAQGQVAPEMWLVLGVLAVVAAAVFVIAGPFLGSSGGAQGTLPAATVPSTDPIGPSLTTAAPVAETQLPLGGGEEAGAVDGLPARCFVDTRQGVTLGAVVECDGVGGLEVVGFTGPWHNNISEVSVDPGVVGQLNFQRPPSDDAEELMQLGAGSEQSLTEFGSSFGIESIVLEFSENGQQVTFDSGNGQQMTLVFRLEL